MTALHRLIVSLAVFGGPLLAAVVGLNLGYLPSGWAPAAPFLAPAWLVATRVGLGPWVRTGTFHAPRLPVSSCEWLFVARRRLVRGDNSLADLAGFAVMAGALAAGATAPDADAAATALGIGVMGAFVVATGRAIAAATPRRTA